MSGTAHDVSFGASWTSGTVLFFSFHLFYLLIRTFIRHYSTMSVSDTGHSWQALPVSRTAYDMSFDVFWDRGMLFFVFIDFTYY